MVNILAGLLMAAAAWGAGALVLRLVSDSSDWSPSERLAIGFGLGCGGLGWLVFFPALAHQLALPVLWAIVAFSFVGFRWIIPDLLDLGFEVRGVSRFLVALLALVAGFDVLEALAPPVDADSLAYHFAVPKEFLSKGGLIPIYRAGDGTAPMLQQMTYLLAMALGGEAGLTIWTMISGWGAAGVLFVTARRYLSLNWALALCIVFLTVPAVVYGAGSGQVETRNAMFVLIGAVCVSLALKTNLLRYAVLAGLAAGFYMGSKYTGLLFAFACGCALLGQRRWFAMGAVFSVACLAAGGQWYAWNWWITGDPIFPTLYGVLSYPDHVPWNDAIHEIYLQLRDENVLPQTLFWFFAYPVKATLAPHPAFESLTVGFGSLLVLMLPFALIGAALHRRRIVSSDLFPVAAIAVMVYALWFFMGSSQRVRYLLPVLPLALLLLFVASERASSRLTGLRAPLVFSLTMVGAVQIGGHALFSLGFAERLVRGDSRAEFFARNVLLYPVVPWVNGHLTPADRLLLTERQLVYLIDVPVFYGLRWTQASIETHGGARDVGKFWRQLKAQKVTHILTHQDMDAANSEFALGKFLRTLRQRGCVSVVKSFNLKFIQSRTLQSLATDKLQSYKILAVRGSCEGIG